MSADPEGYYARLGLTPQADPAKIAAAFRKAARRLHPDVPGTGDVNAFVALKAAYDVLGDPAQRAQYDAARIVLTDRTEFRTPRPGFGSLPMAAWLSILGVGVVASISAFLRLTASPPTSTPRIALAPPEPQPSPRPATTVVRLAGPPTHYVAPGNGPAPLWRDISGDRLVAVGALPAFTSVRAVGAVPERGMMIIALADGGHIYMDAARLEPGGATEARAAYCADQAGAPPGNAELLAQRGRGDARVVLVNRGAEPVVVKLRDAADQAQALVYVAPAMRVTVIGLPGGPWHADVAIGEMWSRACGRFAAGMETERLPGTIEPGSTVTVPPQAGTEATEISDQDFMRN